MNATPPRLLDRMRAALRTSHYSLRTEDAYVQWAKRYIIFHGKRHPSEMGAAEINEFLSSLAVDRNVSAATQNQALCALLFLYRQVLGDDVPWLENLVRAPRSQRLPVVLTPDEVRRVVGELDGVPQLVARLLYGSGLRLLECLRMRIKDIDFDRGELTVREGKGSKDRRTMLPASIAAALRRHLESVRALHDADLASGGGRVTDGHNVFPYRHPSRRGEAMEVDFGVEVSRSFTPSGEVHETTTPAGETAIAVHRGAYAELHMTHEAIHEWAKLNRRPFGDFSWEIYGDWSDDPTKLETTVLYLLA